MADGGGAFVVNDRVRLTGIPPEAHRYQVNGRTRPEWFIDRYHVKRDRRSGAVRQLFEGSERLFRGFTLATVGIGGRATPLFG